MSEVSWPRRRLGARAAVPRSRTGRCARCLRGGAARWLQRVIAL